MNPNPQPSTLPAPVLIGLQSLIPSVVRTLVPVVLALVVRIGFADVMDNLWVERVLTLLVTMAYYVAVRVLEQRWAQIGWLLGYGKAPAYVAGTVISAEAVATPTETTTTIVTDEAAPDA